MTEDLDVFFSDVSVPVVIGGVTLKGLFDEAGAEKENMMSVDDVQTVIVKTSDLSSLTIEQGTSLTVNGQSFTIHTYKKIDDGALTKILLDAV